MCRYSKTLYSGDTFNINLVGMLSRVWRKVLDFSDVGVKSSLQDHVRFFSNKTKPQFWGMWGLDQVIQ